MAKRAKPQPPTSATTAATAEAWDESIGSIPHKVTVFEMVTRKRVLYLRWRRRGNWRYESLKEAAARDGQETPTLFDRNGAPLTGRALEAKKRWARQQAEAKFAALKGGLTAEEKAEASPLTLGETWTVLTDPKTGKYPSKTSHRQEVEREVQHVVRILGADLPWSAIRRADLRRLWRTRIEEIRAGGSKKSRGGIRGAEITVTRLLAIAQWLRDEEKIPADACVAASTWRRDLRSDWLAITGEERLPEVFRPRFTPEEFLKLIAEAWHIDPRFALAYALGAELRGGQVRRARRSDLTLPELTRKSDDFGRFAVPGRGKKGGTIVDLTRQQRAAVDRALDPETGYLRELEAARLGGSIEDYYLFPAGQMPGVRIHRRGFGPTKGSKYHRVPEHAVAIVERHASRYIGDYAMRKWFRAAEDRAGIKHVDGRLWHGGRRVGVDMAKREGASREALQEHGGWSDSQVPDSIYADRDREYARREARDVRARYRGENEPPKKAKAKKPTTRTRTKK